MKKSCARSTRLSASPCAKSKLLWNVSPGPRRPQTHARNQASTHRGRYRRRAQAHHRAALQRAASRRASRRCSVSVGDLEGAYSVADVVNRKTGEVLLESNKPLTAELWHRAGRRRASPKWTSSSPSATTSAWCCQPHPRQGRHQVLARSADRDLSQAAPRRSADPGNRHGALQRHVLRPAQVRFQQGRPPEVQHQARPRNAARQPHSGSRRFRRRHQATC